MQDPQQLDEAVKLLLSRAPDFANARSLDSSFMSHARDDSPYLVYGDFGFFLLQQLSDKHTSGVDYEWLRPYFQLIDEMLTSPDPELVNLVQVGVLEVLSDQPDAIEILKGYLSVIGREKLEDWIRISQTI